MFDNNFELYFIGQVVLAGLLGAVIGWQRESCGKAAGPRTYALVSAGSALFTLLSLYGFTGEDTSRVASNIVIGIGFLGAGIIFRREEHVEGLTTAASLWATAAVGMAIGAHFYLVAAATTLFILGILLFNYEKVFKKEKNCDGSCGADHKSME